MERLNVADAGGRDGEVDACEVGGDVGHLSDGRGDAERDVPRRWSSAEQPVDALDERAGGERVAIVRLAVDAGDGVASSI